jgi:23S rRNA (adenine2503-C2)-methyltransferase
MNHAKLKAALAGEKPYRLRQAEEAVYRNLISSWDEATSLPPALREKLEAEVPISTLAATGESVAAKGNTVKATFRCEGGAVIEAVIMHYQGGRNTVCVSSQAGCPMACAFCATGTLGLKRNLTVGEIVDQVLHFARILKTQGETVKNVVVMGMGEPFHNYDNVMAAIRILNDAKGLAIGARKLSISTCGLVPGILRLADEPLQVNLAISLHAPDDELRSRLMPVNNAYPLAKLFAAIRTYLQKTNRKVMFEYLLISGVNDSLEQAAALADLLVRESPAGLGQPTPLYHVNLIKYNPTEVPGPVGGPFEPSSTERCQAFMQVLYDRGVSATQRMTFGSDIEAACGQLVAKNSL